MTLSSYVQDLLDARLPDTARRWLNDTVATISAGSAPRQFFLAFSQAVRHCGNKALVVTDIECAAAERHLPGWQPRYWRCDDAARVLLLLADVDKTLQLLDELFQSADLGEAHALYLSLPLLPDPPRHVARACEGLRSNVKDIFEAVAHYSPLPLQHFDDTSWNQMVLKALFIDSSLDPIYGLEQRANPQLTRMLCDYANERRAASRSISIELWRCVGACPDDAAIASIARLMEEGSEREQLAAALSIKDCRRDDAQALLQQLYQKNSAIHEQLTQGLCWQELLANP